MKALLIVNPVASSVTSRERKVIQQAIAYDHDLTIVETERRGHATRLAQTAMNDGAEAVIVFGGDGTLNEAANGLVGSNTALGVIPGGSTNVFARTIGMTNDPIDATAILLNSMNAKNTKRIGLGNANGRHFLFHVGIGFDAAVIEQVEKRGRWKRYGGHQIFVWSTLLTWARYGAGHKPRFAVRFPDVHKTGKAREWVDGYLTICLNSNPYTFLGNRPFNIAPELTFEKGLAVLTVKSLNLGTFGGIIGSALMTGRKLRKHPRADYRTDIHRCEITGYGKFPYQLDGDYLGDVDSLTLRHDPEVLDLFLPL